MQVWLCLGITLIALSPVLSFLSGFYRKYIKPAANKQINRNNNKPAMSVVNFADILHNSSFLLSHITNQGILCLR